jgi:hypothetical protein
MRASQVPSPGLAAERGEAREGPRIGFLEHVLGLGAVAHDTARDAVETLVVLPDE